jgi:hypothetical protein
MYKHYGMAAMSPTQVSAPEAAYGLEQTHVMPVSQGNSHLAFFPSGSHESLQTQLVLQQRQHISKQQYQQGCHQRQSSGPMLDSARSPHNYPETHQIHAPDFSNYVCRATAITPHSQNNALRPQTYPYSSDLSTTRSDFGHSELLAQAHHHHHLSNQRPPLTPCSVEYGDNVYTDEGHGSRFVVGQPGMPEPAAKPKGPKLRFSLGEDALLVELKETKNLTWKQIADFFPGRSSGTLQVRYCTKLKATAMVWTEDKVGRCRTEHWSDRELWMTNSISDSLISSAKPLENTSRTAGSSYP